MTDRRWGATLAAVCATAILLRVAHVATLLGSPLGDALVQDARLYHLQASRILGLLPPALGDPTPFNNLGYPYLLAAVYAIFGPRPAVALYAQALLGGLSVALLALAVRDLLRDGEAALLAAALYAVAPSAMLYDGTLLTPSPANLALLAALAALGRLVVTERMWLAAASGLALGIAILLRTNLALAVPAFALAAAWPAAPRRARGAGLGAVALLTACAVAGPAAVSAAGAARTGHWVPLTANGGMNFWLGNNARAQGVYHVAPFLGDRGAAAEQEAYLVEARRRASDPTLTLAGANGFWFREGLAEIRAAPYRWLGLEGRKAALFWSRIETKTNVSLDAVAALSPTLRYGGIRFAFVSALGLGGLALMALGGEGRAFALFGGLVAAAFATCVLFFVSGEYRHAALPSLCAGAGWALATARRRRGTIPRSAWAAAAIVSAGGVALALPSWPGVRRAMPPDLDAGDLVRAIVRADPEAFARARALLHRLPSSPDGRIFRLDTTRWLAREEALARHDRPAAAEALDAARQLLAMDLGALRAGYEEGFLAGLRDTTVADVKLIAAQPWVAGDPGLSREGALLGSDDFKEARSSLEAGHPEDARAFLEEALARTPGRVEPTALLGQALYALGDRAGAIRAWGASCDGWPRRPECAAFVGAMYLREGNLPQARVALDEALRRDPAYEPALRLRSELR